MADLFLSSSYKGFHEASLLSYSSKHFLITLPVDPLSPYHSSVASHFKILHPCFLLRCHCPSHTSLWKHHFKAGNSNIDTINTSVNLLAMQRFSPAPLAAAPGITLTQTHSLLVVMSRTMIFQSLRYRGLLLISNGDLQLWLRSPRVITHKSQPWFVALLFLLFCPNPMNEVC